MAESKEGNGLTWLGALRVQISRPRAGKRNISTAKAFCYKAVQVKVRLGPAPFFSLLFLVAAWSLISAWTGCCVGTSLLTDPASRCSTALLELSMAVRQLEVLFTRSFCFSNVLLFRASYMGLQVRSYPLVDEGFHTIWKSGLTAFSAQEFYQALLQG